MSTHVLRILGLFVSLLSVAAAAPDAHPAHRVVVVVWDGMRPDFISPVTTPNLWRLEQRGVLFAHHHPVYLSSTEVNGTAMATGAYPERSSVIANTDYRPGIDPLGPVGIEVPAVIRRGDEVSDGHYLNTATVAEILHAHGRATVIAGAKQVALLFDRQERSAKTTGSPVLFEGATLPPAVAADLAHELGAFPPAGADEDKVARDAWTTRALIGLLWRNGVPDYSVLWLAEPDASQHASGPGSAQSLAAIKSCDGNLGLVLAELAQRGLLDTTDVLVVSDHGFSTINRKVDVAAELKAAGFTAGRKASHGLAAGQVIVVGNGGSSLLYVGGHEATVIQRLAAWLQQQDWTGVVFAREPLPGTFSLAEAHINAVAAPDLVVSLRWSHERSANGTPGLQVSDLAPTSKKVGNHASLSPYDMHNTLVAAGPDFRAGVTDTLPSANTDLAPTILWCLGLPADAQTMDGRVLGEALSIDAPPVRSYHLQRLTAHQAAPAGQWNQYLQVSEVNGVRYLDEGDGEWVPTVKP
ncbi:MAG: alkaline phosphatase family protein [Opitutales bacterium]